MKTAIRLFSALFISLTLAISALGILPARPAAAAAIIYVDDDAAGAFDGTSWTNAYKRLQNAMAVASSGDQIWVAAGVYYPDEGVTQVNNDRDEMFIIPAGVSLYGGFAGTETQLSQRNVAANPTILSGDIDKDDINTDGNNIAESTADIAGSNAYHVVSINGVSGVVLDGFTITAGDSDAAFSSCYSCGGGLEIRSSTSVSLANLVFSGNYAQSGGALHIRTSSTVSLTDLTFTGNSSDSFGGAVYDFDSDTVTYTGVTFTGNESQTGGAVVVNSTLNVSFSSVLFSGNQALAYGGALDNIDGAVTVTDGVFSNNSAGYGGAVVSNTGSTILNQVTLKGNSATVDGGAFYSYDYSFVRLTNVTVSGNSAVRNGGGLFNYSVDVELTNTTINDNSAGTSGGGLYNDMVTVIAFKNTLVANSGGGGDCVNVNASLPTSSSVNNLIEDGVNSCGLANNVDGNITGQDPNVGPLQNNGGSLETHALIPGSWAINAGTNTGCPAADARGVTRPQGTACDIGAYEIMQASLTLTSTGSQDGWILETSENGGAGSNTLNSSSTTLRLGDDAARKQYRSILSFTTSGLPDDASIARVLLRVKRQGVAGGGDPVSTFQGFLVDVKNGSFGTSSLQASDWKATANIKLGPTIAPLNAGWYELDLTAAEAFVNRVIANGGLTQIRLRFQKDDNNNSTANYLSLYSGNAAAGDRPQLIVEYFVP